MVEDNWKLLYYCVYDTPGSNKNFSVRSKNYLEELPKVDNPYLVAHP